MPIRKKDVTSLNPHHHIDSIVLRPLTPLESEGITPEMLSAYNEELQKQEEANLKFIDNINKQKEAEKLAPKDTLQAELLDTLDEKQYKEYKDNVEKRDTLQNKKLSFEGKSIKAVSDYNKDAEWNWENAGSNALLWLVDSAPVKLINNLFEGEQGELTVEELNELKSLDNTILETERPILEKRAKIAKELELIADGMDKTFNFTTWKPTDKDLITYFSKNTQADIEARLNGNDGFWYNFSGDFNDSFNTTSTIGDRVSGGLLGVLHLKKYADIIEKERSGEELTEAEENILKAGALHQDNLRNLSEGKSWLAQLGEQSGTSAELAGAMMFSRGATKGISAGVVAAIERKALSNLATKSLLVANQVGRFGTEVFMQPFTYDTMLQEYVSPVAFLQKENTEGDSADHFNVVTDEVGKKQYKRLAESQLNILEENLLRLNSDPEANAEAIKKAEAEVSIIHRNLGKILNQDGDVTGDVSWGNAFIKGYTESAKEMFSELFVGKMAGKVLDKVENKLIGTAMGSLFSKTRRIGEWIPNVSRGKFGQITRSLGYHSQFGEVFQGIPEEMLEEVWNQFVPSYNAEKGGYTFDDYIQQLEGFKDPNFWTLTAASTILMGGITTVPSTAKHLHSYRKDVDYREAYDKQKAFVKDMNEFYRMVDRKVTDPELARRISMATGKTLHSDLDIMSQASKLRLEGDEIGARTLEESALMSVAMNAMSGGSLRDMQKTLMQMARSKNLNPGTASVANKILTDFIPQMQAFEAKHKSKINFRELIGLKYNDIAYDKKVESLRNKIEVIEESLTNNFTEEEKALWETGKAGEIVDVAQQEEYANLRIKAFQDHAQTVISLAQHEGILEKIEEAKEKNNEELEFHENPENIEEITKQMYLKGIAASRNEKEIEANRLQAIQNGVEEEEANKIAKERETELLATTPITRDPNSSEGNIEIVPEPAIVSQFRNKAEPYITSPNTKTSNEVEESFDSILDRIVDNTETLDSRLNNLTEKDKEVINNYLEGLKKYFDVSQVTLSDLLNDSILRKGLENTEKNFDKLVDIADTFNIPTAAASAIKEAYFGKEIKEEVPNPEVGAGKAKEVNGKTKKDSTPSRGVFDPATGTIINERDSQDDTRTDIPDLKFAYQFQNVKIVEDPSSPLGVKYIVLDWDNLNTPTPNDIIQDKFILDPEFMHEVHRESVDNPGSLRVVPLDYDEAVIKVNGVVTTWGEFKKTASQTEKISYKPMAIMYSGKLSNGKIIPLSLVHDPQWYDESHVLSPETRVKGANNVLALRKQAYEKGEIAITVDTGVRGSFAMRDDGVIKPVSEQNPHSHIAVFDGSTLKTNGIVFNSSNVSNWADLEESDRFNKGSVVHVNQTGVNDLGKPMYTVFTVINDPNIINNENIAETIRWAILSTVYDKLSKNPEARKALEENFGLTPEKVRLLKSNKVTSEAINMLTFVHKDSKKVELAKATSVGQKQEKIHFAMYKDVIKVFYSENGKYKSMYFDTQDLQKEHVNGTLFESLGKVLDQVSTTQFNVNSSKLKSKITLVDKDGNLIKDYTGVPYSDLVKDTVKTSVVSYPIETVNGGTKWVTNIQPMIYFDPITSEGNVEPISTNETVEEVSNETQEANTLTEQKADIERRREEEILKYLDTTFDSETISLKEEREEQQKINAKYDAEYVDAVKKGVMTKEQAMQSLEKAGRKDSSAYAEIAALENTKSVSGKEAEIERINKERAEYGLEPLKPTYRGTSLEEWENIKNGEVASSDNMQDATWVSDKKEYSEEYVKTGEGRVLIEFKPEAIDKSTVESGQENDDTGVRIGRGLRLEDVQRVTDSEGNVIYDAETAALEQSTSSDIEAQKTALKREMQEELDERIPYIPHRRKQETEGEHEWQRESAKEFNKDIRQGLIKSISIQQQLLDQAKEEGDKEWEKYKTEDLQEAKDDLKIFDEINAEYNAKLKALESKTESAEITEDTQSAIEADIQAKVEELRGYLESGVLTQEMYDTALAVILSNSRDGLNNTLNSRLNVDAVEALENIDSGKITGLTDQEQVELVDSLEHMIISSIEFGHVLSGEQVRDLIQRIRSLAKDNIEPKIKELEDLKVVFNNIGNTVLAEDIQIKIDKLKTAINSDSIEGNRSNLVKLQDNVISNLGNILAIDLESIEDSINQEVEDNSDESYSKSALEKDIKLTYSVMLKLSLYGVERKNSNKNGIKNGFGLSTYYSPDVINYKILETTTEIPSNWDLLMDSLKNTYKELDSIGANGTVYLDIYNKISKLPKHLKYEMLYKTITKKLDVYMFLLQPQFETIFIEEEGKKKPKRIVSGYNVDFMNENSASEALVIKNNIINTAVQPGLSDLVNLPNSRGIISFNKEFIAVQLKKLDKIIKNKEVSETELRELFDNLGFKSISNETVKYILSKSNPSSNHVSNLFNPTKGMLPLLQKELTKVVESKEELNALSNNPFLNLHSLLNYISKSEVYINGTSIAKSIRVNGKTMQGVFANTLIYDIAQRLMRDPSLVGKYKRTSYAKNNVMLEALKNSGFIEAFKTMGFNSPNAMKMHGKNTFGDNDFDQLSPEDMTVAMLNLYLNEKGEVALKDEVVENENGESVTIGNKLIEDLDLEFRIGRLTSLTLSDKGRILYIPNVFAKLNDSHLSVEENLDIYSPDLKEYLLRQVFDGEFNRVLDSYNNFVNNEKTNITAYDRNGMVFHTIPSMNSITIEYEGKEREIHDVLYIEAKRNGGTVSQEIMDTIRESSFQKIVDYLQSEIDNKISLDGTTGEFVSSGIYSNARGLEGPNREGNIVKESKIQFVSNNVVNKRPGANELDKMRFIAAEFAINSLIHNMNTHQMFLGDPAFYSKDGFIKTNENGSIDAQWIAEPNNYATISEKLASNIDKRAAALIAPGLTLAESSNVKSGLAQHFLHLAVNDVISVSETYENIISAQYETLTDSQKEALNTLKTNEPKLRQLRENLTEAKTEAEETLINSQLIEVQKQISKAANQFPEVSDYFGIEGTDAQEYTTWRTHLDVMYRQGKLTEEELKDLSDKISKGLNLGKDDLDKILQPVKPVYTSLQFDPVNNIMRPVYIKSSSFPLLPQWTKNLKLDNVRKNLERLEKYDPETNVFVPVRLSYQTANKIGSVKTKLTMSHLYKDNPDALLDSAIETGSSMLPMEDFKIQQETPSKENKAFLQGKDSYISMGSQFFKIILGNFVNHDDRRIFKNIFPKEVLDAANIDIDKNTKLSGQELDRIYNTVYGRYSDLLSEQLEREIGMFNVDDFYSEDTSKETRLNILKNLQKIIRNEVITRGYPSYLTDSIEIIEEEVSMNSPLLFDNNRHKFEALLQSVISNRLITHKLPGNAHISGSSEGFTRKKTLDTLSKEERAGIVWVNPDHKGGLKSTYIKDEEGNDVLVEAEVAIASHFKKFNKETGEYEYVDLTSDTYSYEIKDEKGNITGRALNMEMINEELLSSFGFRIPTSSHQSGTVLKVVAFLPRVTGDVILVPPGDTVQLGEDYDIDKRYMYKSNYYVNKEGKIRKLNFNNIKYLFEEDTTSEDIVDIEDITSKNVVNENDRKRLRQIEAEIKVLENMFIDVYKTVYTTTDKNTQQKIFKPLTTDVADKTAKLMDNKLSASKDRTNFSYLSDSYQKLLVKIGADGKGGIGVHSNAVTLEAQLQRLSTKVNLGTFIPATMDKPASWIPLQITVAALPGTVYSTIGEEEKTLDGGRNISDQHGENQNVSTDNINKQIMGKRNENSHTMGVFALMAHMGIDLTADKIDYGGKSSERLHFPSLFMNQPILRRYVELKSKYSSNTADFVSAKEIDLKIVSELNNEFNFLAGYNPEEQGLNFLSPEQYASALAKDLTSQALWDSLDVDIAKNNPEMQGAILQLFFELNDEAKKLSKVQQLINLSTSKLGVSYFEVIQRENTLNDIVEEAMLANEAYENGDIPMYNNFDKLIGDIDFENENWESNTMEGKMLINSLRIANKVMPIFFPYKSNTINSVIDNILLTQGKDPKAKSAATLDERYQIMTALTDYISSEIGTYEGTADEERQRLFFDNAFTGHKSLGSILMDLKNNRNPIMEDIFLKDLQVETDPLSNIVFVKHFAQEQTNFSKSTKYNTILSLLKNPTVLGEYNGEVLTVSKLAQDLVTYSLLADQQNGATGFRQYININYLNKIGVTKNYRKEFSSLVKEDVNEEMVKDFITQYFQHNPSKAVTYNSMQEVNDYLSELVEGEEPVTFINVRNGNKNELRIFNSSNFSYGTIPMKGSKAILDRPGYNEYHRNGNSFKRSLLLEDQNRVLTDIEKYMLLQQNGQLNNPYSVQQSKPSDIGKKGMYLDDFNIDSSQGSRNTHFISPNDVVGDSKAIVGLLDRILDTEKTREFNPGLKDSWDNYRNFVPENTRLVFGYPPGIKPTDTWYGQFSIEEGVPTIYMNPNFVSKYFNSSHLSNEKDLATKHDKAVAKFKSVLVEEVMHAIQYQQIKKGLVDNNRHAVALSQLHDKILSDFAKNGITHPAIQNTGDKAKDIAEFIAGLYTDPSLHTEIEKVDKGFIGRFFEILKRFMDSILGDGVYTKAHTEMLELLKENLTQTSFVSSNEVETKTNEVSTGTLNDIKSSGPKLQTVPKEIGPTVFNNIEVPGYTVDRSLSYPNGDKKLSQVTGSNITINPVTSVQEILDFLKGNNNTPIATQRKEVFSRLQLLGMNEDFIRGVLTDTKSANLFLILYKYDQAVHNDGKNYWAQGNNLTTPDKIGVELRATYNALARMAGMDTLAPYPGQENKSQPIDIGKLSDYTDVSEKYYYEGNIIPEANTIFVFGSNPEGRHGAGAAKIAREQFGAIYGQGEGLQGNAYALPTKNIRKVTTPKGTINVYWGQAESETSTKILSNLALRKFTWEGREYGSVEHAYQSNKSGTFDKATYDDYNNIGGYGRKIRGKGTVAEMKAADNLGLMKKLVVESFRQNPNSEATTKLLQYKNFTHNTNELIDKAFLEGLQLAQKELNTIGAKSISPEQITESIKKLYEVAKQNPNKEFKIAYRNTNEISLNGYTGLEMIEMFNNAGTVPSNIIFSKEWFDTGKLVKGLKPTVNNNPTQTEKNTSKSSVPTNWVRSTNEENKFTYKDRTIETDFTLTNEQYYALERLIDFVDSKDHSGQMTLSGYAGTGKTSIIKYLEKYIAGGTFIYAAPTHAATVYLGINLGRLPFTVPSMYAVTEDYVDNTRKITLTKKVKDSLSFVKNVIVIDEASMISNSDLDNLIKAVGNQAKIVFMGDKAQIPEVTPGASVKNVSRVFTDFDLIQLTEVKRTENDYILELLTNIRERGTGRISEGVSNEGLTYFTNTLDFYRAALESIKENPEQTTFITYTNRGVADFNSKMRTALGHRGDLTEGEMIIGYAGYNSKSITAGDINNSVKYKVEEVKVNLDSGKVSIQYSSNILKSIPDLYTSGKYRGVSSYVPLSKSDSLQFEGFTEGHFEKNNLIISDMMRDIYEAKEKAVKAKGPDRRFAWASYYEKLGIASKYFESNNLGNSYIYNPRTNKMELYGTKQEHAELKRRNSELYIDKGVDYGYATTIHKSQGATFENVFYDAASVNNNTPVMENGVQINTEGNTLNYVGLSRASKQLNVLTAQTENLNTPINYNSLSLQELMQEKENDSSCMF